MKSGPMKADVDGIAEQISSLIEAELSKRRAELDRRERQLEAREEAVRKREQALAAAETPTPSRAANIVEKKGPSSVPLREQARETPAVAAPVASPLLFQAPKDEAKSSEVSSQPDEGVQGANPSLLFQEPQLTPPAISTVSAGTASQLKDRFEQKAAQPSSSESAKTRPYRHSAPAEKSQVRGRAEFSQVSAGTAGELKDLFEQKAQEARRNSETPERRSSWKAVQNKLDLPNAEGTGLFRAHEAPFKRGVKTVGQLGQPKERRSLQELLKADEMCQMAM